jgi:hypothetical protein
VPVPVYGAVPPVADTATAALPPLQDTGVVIITLAETALGAVTVAETVLEQPLASFTVTVYVPAATAVNVLDGW